MKFSLLLFALHFLIRNAAKRNQAFKHYIRNVRVRISIKTADGKRGRTFIFNRGEFSSQSGDTPDFDVALVWCDAATGFSVLTDKSKDASFRAAAANKLKVYGQSVHAQWFEDGLKLII